nr:cyclin delta-3, putative [Tanacetum cinerariifolium]
MLHEVASWSVEHLRDVAVAQPPEHLHHLLKMLQVRGESIISPAAKQGIIPLAIPLSKNSLGSVTALLRWPTAPPGFEMPVVEVRSYGVWLLAKTVDQYIHRILVEEDAKGATEGIEELFNASGEVGEKLYTKGDFAKSRNPNLNVYLLQKVGMFPDILERKVLDHFAKGDDISAMVTGEFYTKKEHFPGFGRPFVFNAQVLLKVGRKPEAKDAARGALKSPWWTLEEGKQEDLLKGKDAAQISLDEAAFLLDLASVDGTWDEQLERIAECYLEGGLPEIAKFLKYRD